MGEIGGRFEILPDPVALARRVAEWMTLAALAAKGTFRVSLSGGSTPKTLCSRRVAFLVMGREKAAILRAIRAGNSDAHARPGQSIKRVSRQTALAFDEIADVGGACGSKPALLRPAPDCGDVQ